MTEPKKVLERARTVAVVGITDDPDKPSHQVPAYLQSIGFRVIPVNPALETTLGEKAYASLAEIPEHVDVVDVFRSARHAPEIARQAVAIGADALWLQQGIRSDEARTIAEEGGIDYVEDRCMRIEAKLHTIRH